MQIGDIYIFIDNKKLEGFGSKFSGFSCRETDCEKCGYCGKMAEKSVRIDRKRISELIKMLEFEIDNILGKEIIVHRYKVRKSKYDGNYASVQIEYQGEKRAIFTGSNVLIDQLMKYQNYLPFEATIRKIGRYYTFT